MNDMAVINPTPDATLHLMKSGTRNNTDWDSGAFRSPLYVELLRNDISQLIIVTGYLFICEDGFYSFRLLDDSPLSHVVLLASPHA